MKVCPKCGKQYPDDANFCPVDAGRLVEEARSQPVTAPAAADPAAPAAGAALLGGHFEVGEPMGGGLTGTLYRAVDSRTGAACVVKRVDAAVFPTSLLMQRSERELKQLMRLESPGIARVLAHGKDGDTLWIASELIADSRSLHELVFDDGPMELERASRIILQIGQALADAAKVGVIHRDLAPKNILLGPGDSPRIINFGVAVPTERVPGVPEFVAPEMVEGKPVDQRANIYSLGAVFYFALTGRPPFMGMPEEVHEQHLSGTAEPPSEHVELPEVVDAVVLKALERSASKRFMTLRQLLSAVEHLAAGNFEAVSAAASQSMVRAGKGKDKRRQLSQTMVGYGSAARSGEAQPASAASSPAAAPPADAGATEKLAAGFAMAQEPDAPAVAPSSPDASPDASPAPAQASGEPVSAETQVLRPVRKPTENPAGEAPAPAQASPGDAAPTHAMPAQAMPAQAMPAQAMPAQAMPARPMPAQAAQHAAAGDADAARQRKGDKGKFRETLWFKKGELDAAEAEAAAQRAQAGRAPAADKADSRPIEERYEDDGSVTVDDREKFSLKTGATESMPAYRARAPRGDVSNEELIDELKGGRGKILALIFAGFLALVGIIAYAISSHGGGKDEGKTGDVVSPETEPAAPAPDTPAP